MKRSLSTITASALLGLAVSAYAAEQRPQPVDSARAEQEPEQRTPPPPKPPQPVAADKRDSSLASFDQLDADKNGKLSKSELGADEAVGLEFSKIDRDGDGTISRDEWNAHWAGRQDKH